MEDYNNNNNFNDDPEYSKTIVDALVYFLSMLGMLLFVSPYTFWRSATMRLYKANANGNLTSFITNSRWPFFSFLKKMFFELFFDGVIFISYFIGFVIALVFLFKGAGFGTFIVVLLITYYSVFGVSIVRDIFTLLLLPFQKFLSWVSKPAQQIDVDFHNKNDKD